MRSPSKFAPRSVSLAAAALGLGLFTAAAPGQVVPKELPPPVRGLEITDHLGKQVPTSLQFTDPSGKIISLGDCFNRPTPDGRAKKPLVVQMMYFRCPILCPTVLNKFTETLNKIDLTVGKDFDALIVSFDPRDKPQDAALQKATQLAAYDRPTSEQTRAGWNFLTSSPENSRALADALGFPYRYLPESEQYSHPAAVFVLTPEGRVSRYFIGLNYPASDVKLALLEAAGGKIGTWKDAFVLWCYHYDPSTGKYTLAATRVMQAGGAATVLLIGALLGAMWRIERRKKGVKAPRCQGVEGQAPAPRLSLDTLKPRHLDTSKATA